MVPSAIVRSSLRFREIIRLPTFERSGRGLLSDRDERWIDNTLATKPELGPIIRETGGVRKLRVGVGGRGKRGGARAIYYYHASKERIYLILVYAKNEKDNLTDLEKRQMRRLTTILGAEP